MTDNLFNPEAFEQMPGQISMEQCDPTRYGKLGAMACPHGCVTECARETSAEYVERWEREFAESLELVREGQRIMRRGRL